MKEVPYDILLKREGQQYTLNDQSFWKLMDEIRLQCGGKWKDIAREARISSRQFRRLRNGTQPTVSIHVVDKILSRLGFPHRVSELKWYSPSELVEMGVWKPHNISGLLAKTAEREREKERLRQVRRTRAQRRAK